MIRRYLLLLALLAMPLSAAAVDYTDIWFNPAESGWGVNMVQSDQVMFVTFFIYGPDNKPIWYVATVSADANGNYNGALFVTTSGTYFAQPWNPSQFAGSAVGSVSFVPTSSYTGNLTYSITNGPTVTKSIQRQTLTAIPLAAAYAGAQAGSYTNCNNKLPPYTDFFNVNVTQISGGNLTFSFVYGSGLSCTMSGMYSQFGQQTTISSAQYQCSDGLKTTATISEIKATAQGIEGHFVSPDVGGGCGEDATFSGVLLQ